MAATFQWGEDNGTTTGSPARGATRQVPITNINFGTQDNYNIVHATYSIALGDNSFDKFIFGVFSGTWTQISNVKIRNTAGALGSGVTIKAKNNVAYTTPAQITNTSLTNDITTPGAISGGYALNLKDTPQDAGVTGSSSVLYTTYPTAYTAFWGVQLQTSPSASPGAGATITWTLQYDEQ